MRRFAILLFALIFTGLTISAQESLSEEYWLKAQEADSLGEYNEAVRLLTEASQVLEKTLGKNHPDYATCLNDLAVNNAKLGNYSEAIRLGTEALQIYEKVLGKDHPDYATSLSNLAAYYSNLGNDAEAIRIGTEALQIREKVLGKEHLDYADNLSKLAFYNSSLGYYSEAIKLQNEALQIQEKVIGKNHSDYATCLIELAMYNSLLKPDSLTVHYLTEALLIQEKVLGKDNLDYAETLDILATCYRETNNHVEAIRVDSESLKIREKILGKEHPDCLSIKSKISKDKYELGNYSEAICLETDVLQTIVKTMGRESPNFIESLSNLAIYNDAIENYSEAIGLCKDVLSIQEKVLGKEHIDYARSMDILASIYSHLGNYDEAISLEKQSLQLIDKLTGKGSPIYATALNNLACIYGKQGNYTDAIRLGTDALKMHEGILGKDHPLNAAFLNNLASYNCDIGNNLEAIRFATEALQINKKTYGEDSPDYATNISNLAVAKAGLGNYSESISLLTEATKIIEKIYTKLSRQYIEHICGLSTMNLRTNNLDRVQQLTSDEFFLRKTLSLGMSQRLSVADRNSYWGNEKWYFEERYPYFAYRYRTPEFISIAYDAALLSKGFLLGSEIETRNIITESGDAALVALYDSMRVNQQILDKQIEKPINERCLNTDSLRETITKMERELASKSTTYGSLIANMSIEWKDVQKKLRKNDIAIEFLSFQLSKDSCMYMALTLKKGYKSPKMIPLFEEKQLKAINSKRFYKGTNLYNLVWKPLEEELKDVSNVYFSPSGELYNINIEVLPEIAGMQDSRRYYRLSSTRELALTNIDSNKQNASAAVYGGIKYDTGVDALVADEIRNRNPQTATHRSYEDFDLSKDSIQIRGGWDYLKGTLLEAKRVDSTIVTAKMPSSLYIADKGTETSFKTLDGQGKQLIHIATHGFYYTEKDSIDMQKAGFQQLLGRNDRRYVEDKSLTRSGLLFAGCNNVLTGKDVPEGVDDGILYAKEISRMDLRGLDHLTLSACETGLGDITGEGVFGLQRAFKKAGAHSILMSLWKVNDDATRLFMTRFYEDCLIRKMSKSDALLDAQKYVREYEVKEVQPNGTTSIKRKYEAPEYWAAFILLDAI